jgi:nitrogen-specific signal transduction histidine kinase
LHISHSIVRRHGGFLDFQSQPGKTVFRVCIPVNFQEGSTAAPLTGATVGGSESATRRL